ncbi:MAG: M20/M25/M40 family metallo-hydrolase [Elusimicrobia bacterium]|nr:M20/M25/M40 family metallo-hydrolase [Elusimicrobiota bacterium]
MKINENRMIKNFMELVKIDSLAGKEKEIALRLKKVLTKMGAKVSFDNAGGKTGGNTGNLIAKFKGTRKGKPFILSAHMDTVGPGENIKPILKTGRIISDGTTVLGADCKGGIAIILEIIQVLKENKLPYPPIEVVFTVSEEVGLLGARFLDYSKLKAKYGMIFDSEKALNQVTANAPAADRIEIEIYGKASHAGAAPESGISAIRVAAEAISQMKLGKIDFETTANIGMINGGNATNVITPLVKMTGEARSHNLDKLERQSEHMRKEIEKAAKKAKAKFKFKVHREFHNLQIKPTDTVLKLITLAMKDMGMKMQPIASGGGTDANVFYKHKIKTPIIATGMKEVHSVKEYLLLKEFFNAAILTLKVISKL